MGIRRALVIIRLSKSPDPASTSVQRQREIIEAYCDQHGLVVIGYAEDLAVSAFSVPPMKRKQLRAWLSDERADDYDVIVYWRQDRIVRQPWDFVDLVRWATEHGKSLESATEGTGDVTQHANMLVGFIGAWQASGESRSTSARVKSSYYKLKADGRYPGGRVRYGFKSVACTDGPGFELVPDNGGTAEVVREAARRVIGGESVHAVCADFNRRKIPSSDGGTWWRSSLVKVLRNPALIGNMVTADDYGRLQDALAVRRDNRTLKTLGRDSLILDLVFCGKCGGKMWRTKARNRFVVICRNSMKRAEVPTPCLSPYAPLTFLEEVCAASVLKHGDWIIEEKVTNAVRKMRLDEITRDLLGLPAEYAAHRVTRDVMLARQAELLDEQERLEASEGAVEWKPTGETVAQRWARLSMAERRLWLLRIGVTFKAHYEERSHAGKRQRRWHVESSWIPADGSDGFRERVVRP